MGFIGDVFSGDKGAGFEGRHAEILQTADPAQAQQLYGQSQSGIGQQQAFLNALSAQNGVGNQGSVFAQQQGLANQLGDQAQGIGPNPAQAMLNQATGQNVANQQALMASQRGANANAGLIARQAGMQGAGIQQNAVGQSAIMQAQQQIAARQQLQQQQQMMAGLSSQQVGQQQGALSGYNQMVQNQYGLSQDAVAKQNAARVAMQSNINNGNATVAAVNAKGQGDAVGGLLSGLASGASMAASGGAAMPMAEGGMVPDGSSPADLEPQSYMGKFLKAFESSLNKPNPNPNESSMERGSSAFGQQMALSAAKMFQSGGKVPGHASVSGNSYQNDTVPAVLSPGEVVIPRSVMESKDPAKAAQKFVQALLAKSKMSRGVK